MKYGRKPDVTVHSDEAVASTLHRRAESGTPLGECGNCREEYGHPRNCIAPAACIHGYAYHRQQAWGEQNPNWGKGRKAGEVGR